MSGRVKELGKMFEGGGPIFPKKATIERDQGNIKKGSYGMIPVSNFYLSLLKILIYPPLVIVHLMIMKSYGNN